MDKRIIHAADVRDEAVVALEHLRCAFLALRQLGRDEAEPIAVVLFDAIDRFKDVVGSLELLAVQQ